ncbi:MAG: penicillin-binding protein 2 [Helicobacteraceae bacterium]|nr:penicillin-binding protein 2 [Helicobacteraceae bacterium]
MEKTGKILAIFLLVFLFFVIFLAGIVNIIKNPSLDRGYTRVESANAFRGALISADAFVLSVSERTYSVAYDGRFAKDKPLIAKLTALYLGKTEEQVTELLNRGARVYLARDLPIERAKNLAHLSKELDRRGAFKSFTLNGATVRYGLEITPNETDARSYPYGDLAQPVLGYAQKIGGVGQMGLERFYERELRGERNGYFRALRDAVGNLIYNEHLVFEPPRHGLSAQLTIDARLQLAMETIVDDAKAHSDAIEALACVMQSDTGRVVALATSNRYDAANITAETLPNTRMNAVQYAFEPGSVMKPFILALLLDNALIGRYDLVRGHNGRFTIGTETITDLIAREWFSAENVVIYSSNIGISQLAIKLAPYRLFDGLNSFGFSRLSGIDLPYEAAGELPQLTRYRSDIYRATTGYGYGLTVNFMQLMKAYNVFNNDGKLVAPRLVDRLLGDKSPPNTFETQQVISAATAETMLDILRKTVQKGSAKQAQIDGIFTAGKTGTAHIAFQGGYKDDYHNSFFGFANDGDRRYTIGILIIDPKQSHFASQTAAPIFAQTVHLLARQNMLEIK